MYPMTTPAQMLNLSFKLGFLMAEAQMVVAMRMMGMMGMWSVPPSENARMVSEKISAAGETVKAASSAMMAGKPPALIASAALKPIARRTKSNVKRLARRGPGKS